MNRTRILLADDHLAVREGVATLLEPDFEVVGMVANGQDMLSEAGRLKPDIVILDISMPLLNGLAAARQLRKNASTSMVVFLTVHDEPEFLRAGLDAGAVGYVLKCRLTSDLIPAVYEVLAGQHFISPGLHLPEK